MVQSAVAHRMLKFYAVPTRTLGAKESKKTFEGFGNAVTVYQQARDVTVFAQVGTEPP